MQILLPSRHLNSPASGVILVTFLASLIVFSAHSSASVPMEQQDQLHKQRIISIGGDVTEILYALGVGNRVVAVDTTSLFPANVLKDKPNVGYMRALSAEGVLSVPASMILASESAGPPNAVAALKSSSVKYIAIPDTPTTKGIIEKINAIAAATNTVAKGDALAGKISTALVHLAEKRKLISSKKTGLFVISVQSGRVFVGGKRTSADGIFQLAGIENAARSFNGFKPVTPEAIVAMEPDAVIVMERPGDISGAAFRELPAVKLLVATKKDQIRAMNGLYLLGFGPRTPAAARELMEWIYPNITSNKE